MRLKILVPTEVFAEAEVTKIVTEAENGSFCLLPRHIDFVAALVPGILSFQHVEGREEFLAIDEGILIKCDTEVLVSTRRAVRGPDLGTLKETIEKQFRLVDEREKEVRSALNKLEAGFVWRFIELQEGGHG